MKSSKPIRRRKSGSTPKGRDIIASLREAIKVERAGIPIESRFKVRSVELPDEAFPYYASSVRATREKIGVNQTIPIR